MKNICSFLIILSFFYACRHNSGPGQTHIDKILSESRYYPAADERISYSGRIFHSASGSVIYSMPAVTIRLKFSGPSSVIINLKDLTHGGIQADGNPAQNFLSIAVDDKPAYTLELNSKDSLYLIASDLPEGDHQIIIGKRTEGLAGKIEFKGLWLEEKGKLLSYNKENERKIEFIGNSISCGYGIESIKESEPFSCRTENAMISYASLTAKDLNADYHIVAYSGRGIAQNYDKSKINTMPVIWREIFPDEPEPAWDHSLFIPDIVVINLGTNDFNCGETDTALFRKEYMRFIADLRDTYPECRIVCTTGPMLNDIYPVNALSTIRYLLLTITGYYNQMGDAKITFFEMSPQTGSLGYGADWHPSAEQQKLNARELTSHLKSISGWE